MCSQFALSSVANCVPASVAQSSEVLFDTQEDAASAGLHAMALLSDIYPTGFAHGADLHKGRLALLSEVLKMCLSTFGKATSVRSIRFTKIHKVPTASLDDCNILAKSGRYQYQYEYRKNPISPSHVSLRLEISSLNKLDLHDRKITLSAKMRCREMTLKARRRNHSRSQFGRMSPNQSDCQRDLKVWSSRPAFSETGKVALASGTNRNFLDWAASSEARMALSICIIKISASIAASQHELFDSLRIGS
jgi:hypothetical protein